MNPGFRSEIDITVWLAKDIIADVAILPRSRLPLTRRFAGKPVSLLLSVLPRLFSLCSVAHQVAFLGAVEAARGEDCPPETMHRRVTAVVAERLTELFRGLFVGQLTLDSASATAVRAMMQATAVLGGVLGEGGPVLARCDALSHIKAVLAALGFAGEGEAPTPGSALAAHLSSFDGDALLQPVIEHSFLSVADDLDVLMRLLADGASFSDAPDLHGRIPETGVWARRVRRQPVLPPNAGPAERPKARIAEVVRLCSWLAAGDEALEDGVVQSYRLGAGRGAAAVECARGRLYQVVECDNENRIVRFESLAPTEWNFHARGPLVRSLQGSALVAGRQGQNAVRTLVGSFDPCVGFNLSFREVGHA
ncbi:nickel-dependent hydrogenase large subunit [Bradyrhizobium diversitatis]|uniref:Nickel-dependent hydrogenase large subunit n=1 Tax=Bradyrhizobium diversitatis TaxID=2755406 RepID=A0ABS0NZ95_9BRAD|nr:nickel-dependent hydrogenase large subunit [Bradyrhizobium diversitatis]MBH5386332.1 nickel-dependent hydrogenase large subunit [Bradyrhizobium diversitatis]